MAGLAGAGGTGGGPLAGLGSLLAGKGVVAIVTGVLVGAVGGGALVASGGVHFGTPPAAQAAPGTGLALVPCPDQGPVVGDVAPGEQVLVTGRTSDNVWLELYYPAPGLTRAWTRSGPLQLQGDLTALPIHACDAPSPTPGPGLVAAVSPSPETSASPAPSLVSVASPSPSPGVSPSPTTNGGPKLSSLTPSTRTLFFDQGSYCARGASKTVTFTVGASDSNGISGLTLFWADGGGYQHLPMTRSGSSWSATLSSASSSISTAGSLAYYVQATDSAGATSRDPASGSAAIAVAVCTNTGPAINAASAYNPLYWNPLGAGGCQTTSNMTASVSDVDGLKSGSVVLHFMRPGSSTWSTKTMVTGVIAGKWYANLDTLGDKISITRPPRGTLSWYVTAQDKKGATGKTATHTITIKRCDSEARLSDFTGFSPGAVTTAVKPGCPLGTTTSFKLFILDVDSGNLPPKIRVAWKAYSSDGPLVKSGTTTATSAGVVNFNLKGWPTDAYTFNFTITTTDIYGGTTVLSMSPLNLSANQC